METSDYPTPVKVMEYARSIRNKMVATSTPDAETSALLNALSAIADLAKCVTELTEQVASLQRQVASTD